MTAKRMENDNMNLKEKIKSEIEKMSKETDRKFSPLWAEFLEIRKAPYLAKLKPAMKAQKAFQILRGRVYKSIMPSNIPMEKFLFICIAMSAARTIIAKKGTKDEREMTIANAYGLAKIKDEKEKSGWSKKTYYASIVAFDEGSEILDQMESNSIYKGDFSFQKNDFGGWNLGVVKDKTIPETFDAPFPNTINAIKNVFETTQIADLEFEPSKNRDDLRLVYGSILSSNTPTKNGRKFGIMNLMDDSVSGEFIRNSQGLTIFINPDELIFAEGSLVYVLGDVIKSEDSEKGVRLTMNAHFMLPDIGITLDMKAGTTAPSDDEVDNFEDEWDDGEDDEPDENEPEPEPEPEKEVVKKEKMVAEPEPEPEPEKISAPKPKSEKKISDDYRGPELRRMKKVELVQICKDFDLDPSGKHIDLWKRILEYQKSGEDQAEKAYREETPEPDPEVEPDPEFEDAKKEEDEKFITEPEPEIEIGTKKEKEPEKEEDGWDLEEDESDEDDWID